MIPRTETISFQSKKTTFYLYDFDYKWCGLMIGFAFLFRSYRSINTVVLGGTHQENDYNTNVNDDDTHFIYDGCIKLIPSIKRAEIAFSKVGLRPGRNRVRLERNIFTTSKNMTHMVKMLLLQFAAIKLFVILMAYISCSLFSLAFSFSLSFSMFFQSMAKN